ncbi:MAG: TIGR03790 family protein, partial [Thermoplasmata archaeon]|nr:TIGR03790 family protein [Thermoplasmata archaeon]
MKLLYTLSLAAFLLLTLLIFRSSKAGALSLSVGSPELFESHPAELNLTFSSDNEEDIHVEVYAGRPDYGGLLFQEFNLTVSAGEDTNATIDLTPSLGENPLFIFADSSTEHYLFNATLWAGPDYSDVLLIINNNSAVSKEIGDHFLQYHDPYVCYVDAPAKETITREEFNQTRRQIEDFLENNSLTDRINYIITTKGVPLRVSGDGKASFDSELTLILGPYSSNIGGGGYLFNPYHEEDASFSRGNFDIYLVNRLTGYTTDEVKALIDRGVRAFTLQGTYNLTQGRAILDVDPGWDGGSYQIGNDWLRNAAQILEARGYPVHLNKNDTFLRYQENVSMYASWGSNDHHYFLPHGKNTGMESDSNADDVPDNWVFEPGSGMMNRTNEDNRTGDWSVRIIRNNTEGESALLQNFTPEAGKRYYLRGYANLSGISGGRGVHLQLRYYDHEGKLIKVVNGSSRKGTTSDWV